MVKHSVFTPRADFSCWRPVGKPQWSPELCSWCSCAMRLAGSQHLHTGAVDSARMVSASTLASGFGMVRHHDRLPIPIPASPPHPPPRIRDNDGYDPDHSALWYLISSSPLLVWTGRFESESLLYWGWLARVPHLLFGLFLGASLWYVARRLYGNEGGFVALTLYCFSPGMIRATGIWSAEPEIGAVWAAFGAIFTGIAVAHTLYAPAKWCCGTGGAFCCSLSPSRSRWVRNSR